MGAVISALGLELFSLLADAFPIIPVLSQQLLSLVGRQSNRIHEVLDFKLAALSQSSGFRLFRRHLPLRLVDRRNAFVSKSFQVEGLAINVNLVRSANAGSRALRELDSPAAILKLLRSIYIYGRTHRR